MGHGVVLSNHSSKAKPVTWHPAYEVRLVYRQPFQRWAPKRLLVTRSWPCPAPWSATMTTQRLGGSVHRVARPFNVWEKMMSHMRGGRDGMWYRDARVVILAMALVMVCAACGNLSAANAGAGSTSGGVPSETPPPGKGNAALPTWSPALPKPGEVVYPTLGVRTLPAPHDALPSLSAAEAEKTAPVQEFLHRGLATGEPTIELRTVTTGDFPPGSDPPDISVKNRLAWVFTFGGSKPDYRGRRGFTPPATLPRCDLVVIIDAQTGSQILIAQICPGTH
jgi:hypothetical protein